VEQRSARVRAHAKINLSLKVLGKRPDGFHELRTVFQTISLADTLDIGFTPGRRLAISLDDPMALDDNLVTRAARLFTGRFKVRGELRMKLTKRIPAGAGLGGGSSDAAAVLLALPALTGKPARLNDLMDLGAALGSDVAFFLAGGTALGIGRGEELYPLPESKPLPVLVLAPKIHVSTPDAYRALNRPALTSLAEPLKINSFQSFVWQPEFASGAENDFEAAVFRLHPELERWLRKLERSGARVARLSGSGAALFGVFPNQAKLQGALPRFRSESLTVFSTGMLTRRQYRARWSASLREHAIEGTWPPQSRHLK
jgi:4-diphosphocytidyl-2-C-methyl-D-erythritol kinase